MTRYTHLFLCIASVLLVSDLRPTTAQESLALRTGDGLVLEMSLRGEVTGLSVGGREIRLTAPGGFFLIDYKNQPEPENLVPNAGFEEGATGWALAPTQALDQEVAHSGATSARLHVPGPESANSNLGVRVPVKPGGRYRVGIWMRRHDCGVCGAYASELDAEGKLAGKVTQVGLPVPREDDVWHYAQRELEMGPNTTQLSLRADIYRSTGTIWLDDFHVSEIGKPQAQPVLGETRAEDEGLAFTGTASDCTLKARLSEAEDCLRVEGELKDLRGEDRAIGLAFRLPFDATGWTWWDDLEDRRGIGDPLVYRNTYNCVSAEGACSVYPWSALTGQGAGLSLALPLAQGPRVFVIDYDQPAKQYEVTFFFGLTKKSDRWPGSAAFSFVLYRHDPAWGMRSAAERYYELFPESFVKRPTYEGYLNYANLERLDPKTHELTVAGKRVPDASDFGEGYEFIWHLHGCYCFRMFHTDDTDRPSDEVVMAFLRELVEAEKEKPSSYCPTSELIAKVVHNAEGRISYIGDTRYWKAHEGYNHTDKPGWGLNFHVNEDPGVSDVLARTSQARVEAYCAEHEPAPFSACLTADAIEGYHTNSRALDYRAEHLRATGLPLTFGKGNLQPAMPNTIWDFLHGVWWPLTEEYKVVTYGNANGYEQAFTLPYCDIPMIEWDWDREGPGRFERYCRALAYQKIWRFWRTCGKGEQDEASVLWHFGRGLAYAIYPAVYPLVTTSGDIEQYRHLYRQYVPAIEQLSRARWEPIPHARTDADSVVVERFGSFADGDLHFTLRNYAEAPASVTVSLDHGPLGISQAQAKELLAYDLLDGPHTAAPVPGERWQVQVPADGARALWVGTRDGLSQAGLRNADYDLGRIERLFADELADPAREGPTNCRQAIGDAAGKDVAAQAEAARAAGSAVEELADLIDTEAPVDLAKCIYRVRADLSATAVAASGVHCEAPRTTDGLRGQAATVALKLVNTGDTPFRDLRFRVRSPWPEAETASRCACDAEQVAAGATVTAQATLFAAESAERGLLPYLIEVEGQTAARPVTIAALVDVVLRPPISVGVTPHRAYRGAETVVTLTLTNALDRPLRGRIELGQVTGVAFQPSTQEFDIKPAGHADLPVRVQLQESVQLGQLLVPFEISGEQPEAQAKGSIALSVTIPVPQAAVHRTRDLITIDGNLQEATWQEPATIPQLGFLVDGKPPSEPTQVWVAHDDAGLYVAFHCAESNMPGLKAELGERGTPLYQDDDVEIFVLPPGETAPLQLAVNALGTQSDNFGNQADWEAAAERLPDGWTVEVFIPYTVLGMDKPPQEGFVLMAQFGRQQKPNSETTAWSPAAAFRDTDRFGDLVFR